MSILLDVLLTEQLVNAFGTDTRRPAANATLVSDPTREADIVGDGGAAVRIETTFGGSLLVTPRRIAREVGEIVSDVMVFTDLVGYDWISPVLSEKVRLQGEHYDRLYLYRRGSGDVVLEGLGPAVYPLMAYLAKVLELRSQKVLLRSLDEDVVALIGRCLSAAAEGPFLSEEDVKDLGQDRGSLGVVATMWPRMNLASPDLGRTVVGVVEALLRRRETLPDAWAVWVGAPTDRIRAALEVFRRVVAGEVTPLADLRSPGS